MDKTRTLPPLVRGKVTTVLEFFVDKIKFFRNILLLTDNFDLVLQVQWWGESLPALIRPKELQIEGRVFKNSQLLESAYHSEKYKIKTTLDLFHSYLKTCEVLELSVLEAVENFVVGSAFLRNLISLLKNNNELISTPIFDYLGEEIGEVVLHVNFSEKSQKKIDQKENKNALLHKYDYLDKKAIKDFDMLSISDDDFSSSGKKTVLHHSHFNLNNNQKKHVYEESQPLNKFYNSTKNKKSSNFDSNTMIKNTKTSVNQEESKSFIVKKKSSSESLPNIKILNDSSKVLYFAPSSIQSKSKSGFRNTKAKEASKFSSNSIKCKSKSKFTSNKTGKEKIPKIITTSGYFLKKPKDIKKEKQSNSKVNLSFDNLNHSAVLQGCKQADIDLPAKEMSNAKILDYLLGSEMSKENEEKALNDFKKMSPSHNLVDSISQLCLLSDNHSVVFDSRSKTKSSCSKQTYLNFDFNNPIERDYYKKFFSKSCGDFEVAELLNHPENSFKLGRSKLDKSESPKSSQINKIKSFSKTSLAEGETKNLLNEDFLGGDINMNNRLKRCDRCKYYKKLDELDTIIESLKHFEQKMIMHEKNLQNADVLIKRSQIAESS